MSNVQSYNALIDRFKAFASGHFILKRFSHGQIEVSDLEKFGEYPFMHVVPSNVTYAKGMKTFSFQIVLADMPRDKEDKSEYQREALSDLQRIAEDLVAEITNHRVLFGDLITVNNVSLEPFLEEFQHTLTGWTVSLDLLVPYYWDACSIPAEWNDFFESGSGGTGSILTFIDSITRDENGNVSLVNDEAEPSPNYYYGTNDEGVRGWYLLTDEVGLTCVTLPTCQTIIDIEAAIDLLQQDVIDLNADVALKANTADISAVGFSNDYNDLDNKPTIPSIDGLVPYEGATQDVELGTHDLYVNKVFLLDEPNDNYGSIHYTDGNFHIEDGDGDKLLVVEDGFMQIHLTDTIQSNLFTTSLTQTRDHYLPNQSGTIALTSDIPSIAGLVPETRTLTINGTTQDLSANRTFSVGTFNLPSLTSGSVLFSNGTTIAQDNSNLFWDDTNNRLGVGTNAPSAIIHSVGSVTASGAIARGNFLQPTLVAAANSDVLVGLDITSTFTQGAFTGVTNAPLRLSGLGPTMTMISNLGDSFRFRSSGPILLEAQSRGVFYSDTTATSISAWSGSASIFMGSQTTNYFRLFGNTGNIILQNGGTFTDAGFRLDVNGSVRATGSISAASLLARGTYLNQTLVATANNDVLVGLDIQSTFTTGAFTGTTSAALRVNGNIIPTVSGSGSLGTGSLPFNNGLFAGIVYSNTFQNYSSNLNFSIGGTTVGRFFTTTGNFTLQNGGTFTDIASARLAVNSTTQGFLPPRMTTTQKNAIASPATGLMVYDTTLNLISVYNGTMWISL